MKKLALAVSLAGLAAPAFATHPVEACKVSVDLDTLTKGIGSDAARVRVRLVFRANMTDLNPPAAEMVSRPADGPWVYVKEVRSSLYERSLSAVVVESEKYSPDDGKPVWSIKVDRPEGEAAAKDAPIKCETYAD